MSEVTLRATKAELLAELKAVQENAEAWMERARKAEKVIIPEPKRVPEAEALAGAIRSLDALTQSNNSYSSNNNLDRTAIERVLLLLASKYGVTLVRHYPCNRQHVEEFSDVR